MISVVVLITWAWGYVSYLPRPSWRIVEVSYQPLSLHTCSNFTCVEITHFFYKVETRGGWNAPLAQRRLSINIANVLKSYSLHSGYSLRSGVFALAHACMLFSTLRCVSVRACMLHRCLIGCCFVIAVISIDTIVSPETHVFMVLTMGFHPHTSHILVVRKWQEVHQVMNDLSSAW